MPPSKVCATNADTATRHGNNKIQIQIQIQILC